MSCLLTNVGMLEPEINVTLSPSASLRQREPSRNFIAALPNVGDAFLALDDLVDDLGSMLNQLTFVDSELSARENISVENVSELVPFEDAQSLTVAQRRALVCDAYEGLAQRLKMEAKAAIRMCFILSMFCLLISFLLRHD